MTKTVERNLYPCDYCHWYIETLVRGTSSRLAIEAEWLMDAHVLSEHPEEIDE